MDKAAYMHAAAGLVLILLLGMSIVTSATLNPGMDEFVDESNEWCADRGGDLYIAQVIGGDGGLHCELPNGTIVDMREVVGNEP